MADLLITGGTLVSPEGTVAADLVVRDGRIEGVLAPGTGAAARDVIEADGLHVLPGAIDVHTHVRDPGLTWKETWTSASQAAAVGGVTTIFDMPNTDPVVATPEAVRRKLESAAAQSCVDHGVYGVVIEDTLDRLRPMHAAGAVAFKLMLATDNVRIPVPSDGAVLEALETLAALGLRTTVHAENNPILRWREHRLRAAGRSDAAAHLEQHTDIAAVEATSRIALFAEWTGAKIHIAHESTRHSLPVIQAAKARGVDLTVETCPHYLLLSTEDGARVGANALRVKPPVREPGHAGPLFDALRSGLIDILSTDHAPHLPEEKRRASIWDCAPGFPGVETSMPLMLREVNAGRLTLSQYVRMACAAPARAFGLARKGHLGVGADADIVLVDMARRGVVTTAGLHSLGNLTPYEGFALHGMPVRTLVRGRTVALDGRPLPAAGWGRNVV
jgi:dihydroorotase